jgi:hypothetical protein
MIYFRKKRLKLHTLLEYLQSSFSSVQTRLITPVIANEDPYNISSAIFQSNFRNLLIIIIKINYWSKKNIIKAISLFPSDQNTPSHPHFLTVCIEPGLPFGLWKRSNQPNLVFLEIKWFGHLAFWIFFPVLYCSIFLGLFWLNFKKTDNIIRIYLFNCGKFLLNLGLYWSSFTTIGKIDFFNLLMAKLLKIFIHIWQPCIELRYASPPSSFLLRISVKSRSPFLLSAKKRT